MIIIIINKFMQQKISGYSKLNNAEREYHEVKNLYKKIFPQFLKEPRKYNSVDNMM